jgi:hypothetical protein
MNRSISDPSRTDLRLLEHEEAKPGLLKETLAKAETELNQGREINGDGVMAALIG